MTNSETLFSYRLEQADETLQDIKNLISSQSSSRSIVNRSYYAMFYAVLALLIRLNISHKSSKHSGIIAIFDKEIVHTRMIGLSFSRMLHQAFEARQKLDYKEMVLLSHDETLQLAEKAHEFVNALKELIEKA
jgi:uncharacterized protein (UPF0332 family)